jgi:hypothetical protein
MLRRLFFEGAPMSLKASVTVRETVDLLNELLGLDHDAIHTLINSRVPCNNNIAEHKTVQVSQYPGDKSPKVGILGILNGLFGVREDGMGAICIEIDLSGRILWFKETPEKSV